MVYEKGCFTIKKIENKLTFLVRKTPVNRVCWLWCLAS